MIPAARQREDWDKNLGLLVFVFIVLWEMSGIFNNNFYLNIA